MTLTPRNNIKIAVGYGNKEVEFADTLYEICDAEFNSRRDIHDSFTQVSGPNSWARYHLLHEVRKISIRENVYAGHHMTHMIAIKIAKDWFTQKEIV